MNREDRRFRAFRASGLYLDRIYIDAGNNAMREIPDEYCKSCLPSRETGATSRPIFFVT